MLGLKPVGGAVAKDPANSFAGDFGVAIQSLRNGSIR